jgi:hypothetical protein
MIFLKSKLKRLRRESAPEAAFKAALRSRLVLNEPLIVHRFPAPVLRYAFATVAIVVVVFLSTTSYAYASSAVTEGDALYPVKTNLENLEGSLKTSPEARARFRARMVDRRAREIAYRLRHDEPLRTQDVQMLTQATNLSVDELRGLQYDEAGRELVKTELKLKLTQSLTDFRTRVELSDLPEDQKNRYIKLIDLRLQAIDKIPAAAPLE